MSYPGLIVTDLDLTLLQTEFYVKDKDLQALRKAHDLGYLIALCSGRSVYMLLSRLEQWGLEGIVDIVIGCNGTQYYDIREGGKVIDLGGVTRAMVKEALELSSVEELGFAWYTEHEVYSNENNPQAEIIAEQMGIPLVYIPDDKLVESFPDIWAKGVFFLKSADQQYIRKIIEDGKTEAFEVMFSGELILELLPEGINKGTAINEMCVRNNISIDKVMAIGDEENDLAMLENAGFAVAMGNAKQPLKDIADYITADIENCGLAEAVELFISRNK